jgi:hypothetical protein
MNIIRVNKAKRMVLVGHVKDVGEITDASKILTGKSEVKRQLGRPRRRWEDIK